MYIDEFVLLFWEFFTPALADGFSLVTSSLLKSPGLFSVFWPISIMLYFGWSPLVLLLTVIKSGPLAGIRWSACISKYKKISYVWFSKMNSGLCFHHLFVWSNLNFFIIIIYSFKSFSQQHLLMLSYWSLSDSKSQVSRIFLSILHNAVVSMVSTFPLISKSSFFAIITIHPSYFLRERKTKELWPWNLVLFGGKLYFSLYIFLYLT